MSETTRRGRLAAADANMKYDARMREVRRLMRDLDKQLSKHEARQGGDPENWGFVGDLGNVEQQLTEILRFVGGGTRG